jgi:hypothetical protein
VVYGTGYTYPPYTSTTVYYPAPVTYGYAPVYDPGYGAWNFLAGATFGFIAGAAASNWWGGGCCGWHGDTDIDINRNVNVSRDYIRNLNVNRADLRNVNLNRADFQSLRSNRQDFRNNIYKNRDWSQQLQNTRRSQLNQRANSLQRGETPRLTKLQEQRGERLAGREGAAAERPQGRQGPQPALKERGGERQAAREARSQQRPVSAREARPEQRAKPAELGKNNVFADRDGNVYRRTNEGWQQRDRSSWSRPETRAQPSFERNQANLNRDFGARSRGAERTQSFQRTRSAGAGRGGGGGFGGGGRRR